MNNDSNAKRGSLLSAVGSPFDNMSRDVGLDAAPLAVPITSSTTNTLPVDPSSSHGGGLDRLSGKLFAC